MKSVIQEASSLSKAIEEGWAKAGKPQEFSIRILQEADKNFLGMTIKSAKIALFFGRFNEMPAVQPDKQKQPQQKSQKNAQRRPYYRKPKKQSQKK